MKYLVPRHPTKPIRSLADAMNEIGKQDAAIRQLRRFLERVERVMFVPSAWNNSQMHDDLRRVLAETEPK